MVELDPTVPSRHLLHQRPLHQGHARSEEFRLTAALMAVQDQIVTSQVGQPKDPLQLQRHVPMEGFLHIAVPMAAKVRTVSYHRDLPHQLGVQMEEFLHTVAQTEDKVPTASYHQGLLLVLQLQQVARMVEFHHTAVPMEEVVPIVPFRLLPRRIRQPQDLVRSEEYHRTVAPMEDLDPTVSFQHKVQQRPDLAPTEVSHHTVVPTEEVDRIAMYQHPPYHHRLDHRHHHQEPTTNISHPAHMDRKGRNVFCQSLHRQRDHRADQLKDHPRHLLHAPTEVFLHTAVPMEGKDPIVLSLHDLLQDQPRQPDVLTAEFHRIAVPMVEVVQTV